jgi:hypothetical protein
VISSTPVLHCHMPCDVRGVSDDAVYAM